MRQRILAFGLVGALIAGAITAPLINSECKFCAGDGKLGCSACGAMGETLRFIPVVCSCGGTRDCPLCHGVPFYATTVPCKACDGKGWTPCPICHGDGKKNLLERIPELWKD